MTCTSLAQQRVRLTYDMPLAEIIYDFFDKAQVEDAWLCIDEYEFLEYRPSDLVKLDILVGGETGRCPVQHRSQADFADKAGKVIGGETAQAHPPPAF
jgi:GTP-binding protein LepA